MSGVGSRAPSARAHRLRNRHSHRTGRSTNARPAHQDRAAGPESQSPHRTRRRGGLALLHPLLSVRDGARRGRDGRGRRRQRLSRLRRRHRRQLDRPLTSRCRRGDRRSGGEVPAHVGHRLLLRAAGAAWRGDGRHCAVGTGRSGRSSRTPAPKRSRRRSSSRAITPKRYGIIAFLGSFHGRTLGSLSVTSSRAIQRRGFGPPLAGAYHAPYPNCYRCPLGQA